MLLEICSTAAFAPPPPLALYEPADRRGAGLAPVTYPYAHKQTPFTTLPAIAGKSVSMYDLRMWFWFVSAQNKRHVSIIGRLQSKHQSLPMLCLNG